MKKATEITNIWVNIVLFTPPEFFKICIIKNNSCSNSCKQTEWQDF